MNDENRECPRCNGREIKKLDKQESYMERDGYHHWSKEICWFYCEECDLIFMEGLW